MKGIAKGLIAVGLGLVFLATPANAQINWAVGAGLRLDSGVHPQPRVALRVSKGLAEGVNSGSGVHRREHPHS